jgi:hypothetical protein
MMMLHAAQQSCSDPGFATKPLCLISAQRYHGRCSSDHTKRRVAPPHHCLRSCAGQIATSGAQTQRKLPPATPHLPPSIRLLQSGKNPPTPPPPPLPGLSSRNTHRACATSLQQR